MPKRNLSKSCPRSSTASKNRRKSRKKKGKKKPRKDININITLDLNELDTSSNMESANKSIQDQCEGSAITNAIEGNPNPVRLTPETQSTKSAMPVTPKSLRKESNSNRKRNKSKQSLKISETSSESKGKRLKNSGKVKDEKNLPEKDNSILKFPSMNLFKNIFKANNKSTEKDSNENSSKPLDSSNKATDNGKCESLATSTLSPLNSNETTNKPIKVTNKSSQCALRPVVSTGTTTVTSNVLEAQECEATNGMTPSNPTVKSALKSVDNNLCKQMPQVKTLTTETSQNEMNDKNSKCPPNISSGNKCSDNKSSITPIKSNDGPSLTPENAKGSTSNTRTDREAGKNKSSIETTILKTPANVSKSNQDSSIQPKPEITSCKPLENDPNNSVKSQLNNQVAGNVTSVDICPARPINANETSRKFPNNKSCSEKVKPAMADVAKSSACCSYEKCSCLNSGQNEYKNVCEKENKGNQCKSQCKTEGITDKCTNSTNQSKPECPECCKNCCLGNATSSITGPEKLGVKNPVAFIEKVNQPIKPCEKVANSKESTNTNDGASCRMKDTTGNICVSENLKAINRSEKCTNESDKKEKPIKEVIPKPTAPNVKNRKENQSIFLETDCQSASGNSQAICQIKKDNETNSTTSDLCKCVKANQSVFSETCHVCARTKSTNATNKNSDKGLENKNLFGTPKTKIEKDNESAGQ